MTWSIILRTNLRDNVSSHLTSNRDAEGAIDASGELSAELRRADRGLPRKMETGLPSGDN
jgi:hypothetical protein